MIDDQMTIDSSSVIEITNIVINDEGDALGDDELYSEMNDFIKDPSSSKTEKSDPEVENDETSDKQTKKETSLQTGLDLLKRFHARFNAAMFGIESTFTAYAIMQGKALNILKKEVKENGDKWEAWAAKNLNFMKERTRQKFMLLAKRTYCHNYKHLGQERLLLLLGATNPPSANNADPIGNFLKDYGIEVDETKEGSLSDFKCHVDAALTMERLKRKSIEADFDKVLSIYQNGAKVEGKHIKNMALLKANKGDANEYIEKLAANQGEEEALIGADKKVESIRKLTARLKDSVNFVFEKRGEIVEANFNDQIKALEIVLDSLKKLQSRLSD